MSTCLICAIPCYFKCQLVIYNAFPLSFITILFSFQITGTSCPDHWSLCEFMVTSYCYPIHLRCTYNAYKSHVIGCPGQEHLKACELHQCPHMFKCLTSYCIPTYLLCDGVQNCPNGEDEQSCKRFTCAGLLRCRYDNVCVHPSDICDGHKHCLMSGDDERFCNITMCPPMCTCHGSAIICKKDLPTLQILSTNFKYIMLRSMYIPSKYQLQSFNAVVQLHILDSSFEVGNLNDQMFSHLTALQILIVCRNGVQFIKPGAFIRLIRIRNLDLTGNRIKSLTNYNFKGLQLIGILDLSNQQIQQLEDDTFVGLISLRHLNLSSNLIETFTSRCFRALGNVELIDLTNNSFTYMSKSTFSNLHYQTTILFSNTIYCCYLNKDTSCTDNTTLHRHHSSCKTAAAHGYTLLLTLLTTSALILIINIRLALTQQSKVRNAHNILSNYSAILNLFSPTYVLILSIIYMYHHGDHIYFNSTFPSGFTCISLQILAMSGVLLSPYTRLLIAINRLLVTRYVFTRSPLSARQVALYSIFGWCMSVAITLWGSIKYRGRHYSCFPMLYKKSESLEMRVDIWIYGSLSTVILTMAISIYVIILRFINHQDKQFGRKRKKGLLIKTLITLMIEFQMYVFFGAILLQYYYGMNSFNIFIMICVANLYHGSSPLLYTIQTLPKHACYKGIKNDK